MVRLDAEQYMEKHARGAHLSWRSSRLPWATRKAGSSRNPSRRRPYSVILFDEIEKAHRTTSERALRGSWTSGRLTDGQAARWTSRTP